MALEYGKGFPESYFGPNLRERYYEQTNLVRIRGSFVSSESLFEFSFSYGIFPPIES